MSSEKTIWWKTPPYSNVVGGLILAAILGLLKLFYEWITAPIALNSIKAFWDLTVNSFSYVLNYEFKFWWILVGITTFKILHYFRYLNLEMNKTFKEIHADIDNIKEKSDVIHKSSLEIKDIVKAKNDLKKAPSIEYNEAHKLKIKKGLQKKLEYTADKFNSFVWQWDWIYNDLIRRYEIKHLKPCCPTVSCKNSKMKFTGKYGLYSRTFKCEICSNEQTINETDEALEKLIEKRGQSIYLSELGKN